MSAQAERPDVAKVLAELKDFQRLTVDHAFRRLYLDSDATHRFLVADEVGLGKTLVARGLIVKTIDYLWDKVPRIDVVYICSNSEIARQNINRLNYSGAKEFSLASRITLLPITLKNLRHQKVNFISFTPTTSFDLQSSLGIVRERALLYRLIERAWGLKGVAPMNVLQGMASAQTFRAEVDWMDRCDELRIDQDLSDAFREELRKDEARGEESLRARFANLCSRYQRQRRYERDDDRVAWIGEARRLLARSCLHALEPDLIILDEFQRFRHLLAANSESAELAQGLFTYADEHNAARVVLLSATPYKMYTTHQEEAEEGHYKDFLRTYSFLAHDDSAGERLGEVLKRYRSELFSLPEAGSLRLASIKTEIEQALRKVMVRTERLAATSDRDGMLKEIPSSITRLERADLHEYLGLSRIATLLERGDAIEYWKSTPYALSFMDGYRLKEDFNDEIHGGDLHNDIATILRDCPGTLLNREDIEAYSRIDPLNSRLRSLISDIVDRGAWKLLWLPPSLPYYRLSGPFAADGVSSLTKRLVFSAWQVVPKTIAALLSYEVERRMLELWSEGEQNTEEARRRRRGLLRLSVSDERPAGMPVLGLIYPSSTLSRLGDLLPLAAQAQLAQDIPKLDEMLAVVEERIRRCLTAKGLIGSGDGPADEHWYWAAPMFLDVADEDSGAREWLELEDLATRWAGLEEADNSDDAGDGWHKHIARALHVVRNPGELGRHPDDLVRVLARVAIAGPGVTSLRALQRASGIDQEAPVSETVRTAAASVASSFRRLFNVGEVVALIRGLRKDASGDADAAYWRLVLDYSVDGGLQSVLDEYTHVLRGSGGFIDQQPDDIAQGIAEKLRNGLSIRVGQIGVDVVRREDRTRKESIRMRGRFAMRYGDEKSAAIQDNFRADQVRDAFNSPFWPFVLATTSVGQEGLDFHHYCHAVVHWNLPSNPVDLEQREGRVHRFKGHAVRKNIASRYGHTQTLTEQPDPWEGLFAHAVRERAPEATDLVPFWMFPIDGGATIERHVPMLPLSRDRDRMEALRRELAVYRMVFGQSRQEDLLAYLADRIDPVRLAEFRSLLQINLGPPNR